MATGRKLDLQLSWIYIGVLVAAGIFSCGFAAVGLWWWRVKPKVPASLDEEGLWMRDGRRYLWQNLKRSELINVVREENPQTRVGGMLDLHFGNEMIRIDPLAIENVVEAIGFIEGVLGQPFQRK